MSFQFLSEPELSTKKKCCHGKLYALFHGQLFTNVFCALNVQLLSRSPLFSAK